MKKIIFFLCLFLLVSFKSSNNNDVSIIVHFEQILNEYRVSNGLNPVKIDHSMKEFTDLRSKSLITDYSHNGFSENINFQKFSFRFAGENIVKTAYHSTNYNIAMYCFLQWKNSISHNRLLLNYKIKRFYLSYNKDKTFIYFCLIAVD